MTGDQKTKADAEFEKALEEKYPTLNLSKKDYELGELEINARNRYRQEGADWAREYTLLNPSKNYVQYCREINRLEKELQSLKQANARLEKVVEAYDFHSIMALRYIQDGCDLNKLRVRIEMMREQANAEIEKLENGDS